MHRLLITVFTLAFMSAGCGPGLMNEPGLPGLDVGGASGATWNVAFTDPITITVTDAYGVASVSRLPMAGGNFQVGQAAIALDGLCSRSDIVCPQNVFPLNVTLTQTDPMLHILAVRVNPKGPLALLPQPSRIGNVDSFGGFAVLLDAGLAGMGTCGLLGLSTAKGTITKDPQDPSRGIALSGEISVGYAGGCVVLGNTMGVTGAGIKVELKLGFSATRQ